MPRVTIDGTEYEVREGRNMLEAVIDCGLDLPYFCWHPAMGSVGACRLCAVRVYKNAEDTKGKIAMACMTPALDGTRISLSDPEATEFRRYVIEWLMTNHPHDCPVCDEGGECHLQDMTTMCGQVYRRFRFNKRTYTNQDLGPFVTHEMNRCIQCYRCVRFYRDLAGGRDLDFFGSRNRVYFGRVHDGRLESEFSGNLVEVCPTGVFTDKTLARHYTRKWDLETAPSVCIHCGLGCNTIPGARYGSIRRVTARFNGDVNGYFLCDRGRYGYEFSEQCLRDDQSEAIGRAREMLRTANGVIGIGSPRASIESNFALRKLVGAEHFCNGISSYEQHAVEVAIDMLKRGPGPVVSLAEVELADAILILGVDPTNEAPMLDFAIRQAMRKAPLDVARKLKIPDWDANAVKTALQDAKGQLHIIAPWRLKLEDIAASAMQVPMHGLAEAIVSLQRHLSQPSNQIAKALLEAHRPIVLTGLSAGAAAVRAAADLSVELSQRGKDCGLFLTVPEANTMGVGLIGGFSVDEAVRRAGVGEADTIVVLENDLSRRLSPSAARGLLANVKNLVALDCIDTPTTSAAEEVIAIPSYLESDGTFVSSEGRAQRFFAVQPPRGGLRPAWSVMQELRRGGEWSTYEDVLRDLANDEPVFAPALEAAPFADWRSEADQKVARKPHRFSGRTAKDANWTIVEPRQQDDPATPLAFTMEGDQNPPPAPLIPRFWWPGWNSNEAINKFQIEVGGGLHGGNPGKRLIEAEEGSCKSASPNADQPKPGDGEVWLFPRPQIFGSEELSARGRAIAGVIPRAEVVIHPKFAAKLGLSDGQTARLDIEDQALYLPVKLDEHVVPDTVTVPMGFDETRGIVAPCIARIR